MERGDFVRIDYVGRLENGEIFDLTIEEVARKEKVYSPKIKYRPLPVIVGAGFMIPGIDRALETLSVGEKKSVDVAPEDAFGNRDPKLVRVLPIKVFENVEPNQGMIVDFSGMKGRVQSVSGGRVTVDFNNPLAGRALKYELEVKEKIEGWESQIKSACEFFGIENAEIKLSEKTVDIEASRLPDAVKDRIGRLVVDYVKPAGAKIEKVRFIDVYKYDQSSELKS